MMKPLKAAALIVGSLVMAGAATPAVALEAPKVQAADLSEEVNKVTKHVDQWSAGHQPEALDTEIKEILPGTAKESKKAFDRESTRLAPGLQTQG
jgi:hypothetical protein